jgi:hypothetical protein
VINENQRKSMQYVKNTNGGATKADFIEDWSPIGAALWCDILEYVRVDENGRIWLTAEGVAQLSARIAGNE